MDSKSLKILLIEANPIDERLVREMLTDAGLGRYELVCENTLAAGLGRIHKVRLDIILLDLSLPDSLGIGTFFDVQQEAPDLPLIILTGLNNSETALLAVEHGAQDYIPKNELSDSVLKKSIQYAIKRKTLEKKIHLQATALQTAADVIFITNVDGIFEWVNPAFTKVTGYQSGEVIGKTPRILKSGRHEITFYDDMWKAILNGEPWYSEVTNRHKDGHLYIVEQSITPFAEKKGNVTHFVAIQKDVTARKMIEEQQKKRLRELESLHRISGLLRSLENLEDILSQLLDEVLTALHLQAGAIWLYDNKLDGLRESVSRGWFETISAGLLKPSEGVAGLVFSTGKTYYAKEFSKSTEVPPEKVTKIPPGWGGCCVPIHSGENVVGVMFLSMQLPREISSEEGQLAESMAEIAGATVDRVRLLDETRRYASRLEIINQLGQVLSESLDLNEIYRYLQDAIYGLIPKASTIIFSLYDSDKEIIYPAYIHHEGEVQDISKIRPIPLEPPGKGLQSEVIRTRKPLISNRFRKDLEEKVENVQNVETRGDITRSSLYAPMLSKERVIGVLNLQSFDEDYFTESHKKLLSLIANNAAVAIENARLFQETQTRLARLKSLRAIDVAITSETQMEIILAIFFDELTSQLEVDAADVLLLNPETQMLEFTAGHGFLTDALQHTNLPFGQGYAGLAALERRLVHVEYLDKHKTDFLRSPHFVNEGFISYFGLPLISQDHIQGVLEVFLRNSFQPDEDWLNFLDALAGQASIAIENARLLKELKISNEDLLKAYDDTILGWSLAMDLRDEETEDHTRRVTTLTLEIADEMGISEEEKIHMRRGALLHDIGKIGVPDHILLKPGKLTDEEWIIMRKHPVFARDMLAGVEYLRPAMDIPYAHHERWDGSGYPRGLKGIEIPLSARIFAIIDVYDALTSDRPYRKAWTSAETYAYIQEQAGIQFDPELVNIFLKRKFEKKQGKRV